MKKVLLDTNFLLIPAQFKLDIFLELERILPDSEIYVLDRSIQELKKIKGGFYIPIVDKLIDSYKIAIIKTSKEISKEIGVDNLLLEYGKKGYIIATNDKDLKKELKKKGVSHLYMRQKKTLEFENLDSSV